MKSEISIIIPIYNTQQNMQLLIEYLGKVAARNNLTYEIIFVVRKFNNDTQRIIKNLRNKYSIALAKSFTEGFTSTKFDLICLIDASWGYPTEVIGDMVYKIINGTADIVIASRKNKQKSFTENITNTIAQTLFKMQIQAFSSDIQSGIKIFRKEIIYRIPFTSSSFSSDFKFLLNAKNAGYKVIGLPILSPKQKNNFSISLFTDIYKLFQLAIALKFFRSEIIPFDAKTEKEKGKGFHYKGQEYIHYSALPGFEISFHRLSGLQMIFIFLLCALLIESLIVNWHITIVLLVGTLTVLYFADLFFNLFLINQSISHGSEIKISNSDVTSIPDSKWPKYTVFCPLYKEAHVLPQFVDAMNKLDYPKNKLQIMLLLEEDDKETIEQARRYSLPEYFDIVVVPHSLPKTKPKACNYGLLKSKGEYVVIYDAEDVPDPLQLKKAILCFENAGPKTVCVQAKLNFYNPNQNLLTRLFTAEYSVWFDLVLTGLQSIRGPIPLGGTSNHFRTADLHRIKGWDSFNVTEDCDLGMRLVKQGYQTAVIDSVTLEEANSAMKNWFWQRSRWIKGYMQTYLLHVRRLEDFPLNLKQPHAITFQLVVGGKILSMFINPFMWFITICYFLFRAHIATFIESFFPSQILYMGTFSLLVGNFLYMYYYMIGCAKRGHEELLKYVLFVPFYWLGMSLAAWFAFYGLIVAPHHWSKTKHGLHLNPNTNPDTVSFNTENFKPATVEANLS